MSEITLNALKREPGRSAARAMRREGLVPGVYYHHSAEPIALTVKELDLRSLIYTAETHIVKLVVDGEGERTCIMKDYDFHPVTDRIVHFDLQGIMGDETVKVEVPVILKGQAVGVRDGGKLDFITHRLEVECLPSNLPEHIEIDISGLTINHSVHVSDLNLPNIKFVTSEKITVVTVLAPKEEIIVAAAEPQVALKGKAAKKK